MKCVPTVKNEGEIMIRLYKDLGHPYVVAVYDRVLNVITYNTSRKEGANIVVIVS